MLFFASLRLRLAFLGLTTIFRALASTIIDLFFFYAPLTLLSFRLGFIFEKWILLMYTGVLGYVALEIVDHFIFCISSTRLHTSMATSKNFWSSFYIIYEARWKALFGISFLLLLFLVYRHFMRPKFSKLIQDYMYLLTYENLALVLAFWLISMILMVAFGDHFTHPTAAKNIVVEFSERFSGAGNRKSQPQ